MVKYNYSCKICNSQKFQNFLKVKDYTVSRETFDVSSCVECGFLTTKFETDKGLAFFYQSDDYISHTNSNSGVFNKLYQTVRNITLKQKFNLMKSYAKIDSLFDYGSGTGQFLSYLKNHSVEVTGLEVSDSARSLAISLGLDVHANRVDFNHKVSRETFDAITLWHVLEHVEDLNETIDFLKSKMHANSVLFIAVPNYKSLDARIYKEHWAAYDVPRHLYHFEPSTMNRLMAKHDLKIIGLKPMWFDSIYVSMLSEKYKTGKINYFMALWNGLRSNLNALFNKGECSSQIYIIKKN